MAEVFNPDNAGKQLTTSINDKRAEIGNRKLSLAKSSERNGILAKNKQIVDLTGKVDTNIRKVSQKIDSFDSEPGKGMMSNGLKKLIGKYQGKVMDHLVDEQDELLEVVNDANAELIGLGNREAKEFSNEYCSSMHKTLTKLMDAEGEYLGEDEEALKGENLLDAWSLMKTFGARGRLEKSRVHRFTIIASKITEFKRFAGENPKYIKMYEDLKSQFRTLLDNKEMDKTSFSDMARNSAANMVDPVTMEVAIGYVAGAVEGTARGILMMFNPRTYAAIVASLTKALGTAIVGVYDMGTGEKTSGDIIKQINDWSLSIGDKIGHELKTASPDELANGLGVIVGEVVGATWGGGKVMHLAGKAGNIAKAEFIKQMGSGVTEVAKVGKVGGRMVNTAKAARTVATPAKHVAKAVTRHARTGLETGIEIGHGPDHIAHRAAPHIKVPKVGGGH